MRDEWPNKDAMHTNRRHALQLVIVGTFGRWIRCQSPAAAVVGDLHRWAESC